MINKSLLIKYFEGACTPEEEQEVLTYLAGQNHARLEELMQESWAQLPADDIGEAITTRMLSALEKQTYGRQQAHATAAIYKQPVKWWRHWPRLAAAILIFAVVGTAVWLSWPQGKKELVKLEWKTIYNTRNGVQVAVLPDSSRVWISPESKLSYAFIPGREKERSVQLEGEAFFDVAHDASRPFVIYTGPVATRVLGTAFNVEAYSREETVRVSLVRGAVAMASSDSVGQYSAKALATIAPGEMISYNRRSKDHVREKMKITDPAEWLKGSLVFNDIPLTDALQRVAARYHLIIHYAKGVETALTSKRLTAIFRNESCKEILNNMLFVYDCYIQQQGEEIEILMH